MRRRALSRPAARFAARREGRALTRTAGFTILEVLLVMAVLVMVAAVAFPDLARLGGSSAEAVARQFDAGIARGRAEAMRTGRLVVVTLERSESGAIELVAGRAPVLASGGRPECSTGPGVESRRVVLARLSEGVGVRHDEEDVGFEPAAREPVSLVVAVVLPDGAVHSVSGGGASVVIRDRRGEERALRVENWTGRVSLGAAPIAMRGIETAERGVFDDEEELP